MEVLWWRFYLHKKNKSEYLRRKKMYWQQQLDDCAGAFTVAQGNTIIDMGCGPAGIFIMFPDTDVVAVDPLLDKYEATLPLFAKSDYPRVDFVTAPIETFASTKTFDFVFCLNAINHVSDIHEGFKKLADLAGEKGTIIVSIDAHNHQLLKKIFRIGPGDILHPHQFDLEEYTRFLSAQGFSVSKKIQLSKGVIFDHYILIARRKIA
jgi:2-polyprenyl-6-hydroxyphenyl methylase/3-demethylubiquinone-9 3-methyltransferase